VSDDAIATPTEASMSSGLSNRRVKIVFFGILLGATLSGLDASIVATAAPTIIGDLGQVSLLPWLTTSYLLAQIVVMAVFGKLGDIHGRRRMFTIAICTFLVGSVLCGFSTSMTMLIICRMVQGVGAGGITGLAMALVADLIPGDRLGRYLGYTGLVFAATSVIGPAAGGFFVDHFSWRWAFFVNVPSAVICLFTLIYQPKQRVLVPHRIDIPGAVLLATSMAALLLALSNTDHSASFWSARAIMLMSVSLLAAIAFVLWEHRAAEPLVPLRILANRVSALATLANLLAGIGFTCGIIYPPIFYQAVAGVTAQNSGLLLAPFALSCAMSTLAAGQITDRIGGHKVVPLIGSLLLATGYALLGTITASTGAFQVTLYGMVGGIGVGFVMQTLLYVVQRFSRPSDMGVTTSTVMLARVLGSSLGVAILGSVFTSTLLSGVERRLPGFPASDIQGDPHKVAALSDAVRTQVQDAFASSLASAFRIAVPLMLLLVVAVVALPGRRIRAKLAEVDADSVTEPMSLADAAAMGV
jgi:EmrB/QacA subfamily drug resistance transporter